MEILIGTVVNINNKYVILNDKRYIKENNLVYKLLPYDVVEYSILDDKINIINILSRDEQILFGIIKSINNDKMTVFFPNLPKFFILEIPKQLNVNLFSVVMIKIGLEFVNIINIYDSIKNRINDKKMFLDFYKEQAKLCTIIPCYKESKCHYTDTYKDLTHLFTFNVDPTESKDFDDSISIDEKENKIYIHIVDADSQIEKLSDIDIESFKHSFTFYLPEHVQNILPKSLAEDELSLVEGLERKTITVEFNINPESQDIISHSIYNSTIIIKKKYDYNDFNYCLDKFPSLIKFYNKWKRETLNIPHLKLHVNNKNGKLINYELVNYFDEAHKIIETLMILTNLTISEHIGSFVPQRYHSKIKSEIMLNSFTNNKIIDSILSIKKYKPAVYDSSKSGHFGLGLSTYTHFTSPIRRYFDVVIHRLLAGHTYDNIENILNHINKQEIYIDKLIKCYKNVKLLTYFEENIMNIWSGYVLSIINNGINVILEDNLYELFIFQSEIKISKSINLYDKVNIKIKSINWLNLTLKAIII